MAKPPKGFEASDLAKGEDTEGNELISGISWDEALTLMHGKFVGPEDVEAVLGTPAAEAGPIPFSREELRQAEKLGQHLVYFPSTFKGKERKYDPHFDKVWFKEGMVPLTIENLWYVKTITRTGSSLWHQHIDPNEPWARQWARPGWRFITPDLVQGLGNGWSFVAQTDARILDLEQGVFGGEQVPEPYASAIAEYRVQRAEFAQLEGKGESGFAQQKIAGLKITELLGQRPVEVVTYQILADALNKKTLRSGTKVRTNAVQTEPQRGTGVVVVRWDDQKGFQFLLNPPNEDKLGVLFSRGATT